MEYFQMLSFTWIHLPRCSSFLQDLPLFTSALWRFLSTSKPMDLQKVERVSSTPALSCVRVKDLPSRELGCSSRNLFSQIQLRHDFQAEKWGQFSINHYWVCPLVFVWVIPDNNCWSPELQQITQYILITVSVFSLTIKLWFISTDEYSLNIFKMLLKVLYI